MRIKITAGVLLLLAGAALLAACNWPEKGPTVTATATVAGYGGPVTVTVTLEGDALLDVQAEGMGETQGAAALRALSGEILEGGGVEDVDVVSGATITSYAVLGAGEKALAEAARQE